MRSIKLFSKALLIAGVMATTIQGCSKYDDSEIKNDISLLKEQIKKIEEQISNLNKNYTTLSALVQSLNQNVSIKQLVVEGDIYKMMMSDGKVLSIIGGGASSGAPVIGIAADTDKKYYWTKNVNGNVSFLLDANGKKILVGEIAPVLSVDNDGYWTISYDNGKSYSTIKDSKGLPIKAATASLIKDIQSDNEKVTITLNDGKDTKLVIPMNSDFSLSISNLEDEVLFKAGETKVFGITKKDVAKIVVVKPDYWRVSVTESNLSITAPAIVTDTEGGEISIIYFSSNGLSKVTTIIVGIGTAKPTTVSAVIPTDFTSGNVQNVVYKGNTLAQICQEYIRTSDNSINEQMTVIYPVVDGKADLTKGLEVSKGSKIVWDLANNQCTVTAGTLTAPITKIYIDDKGEISTKELSGAKEATISPELIVDTRGANTETYKITKIGTQYWMSESLRAEVYTDGTAISTTWGDPNGSFIYLQENAAEYKAIYGTLYSGYTIKNAAKLAPAGWSVPSSDDVTILKTYMGTATVGTKLKSTTGWSKNPGTNLTGFNALPAQYYVPGESIENFGTATPDVLFWTSKSVTDPLTKKDALIYFRLYDNNTRFIFDPSLSAISPTMHDYKFGHYVRCVKR